jgi:hypothetical protein
MCIHRIAHTISRADELQRVMDSSNRADGINKFDRLLRLLPLCGALARHPQNLEMIFAGGKCSLVSAIFKVIGYALPPADCCSIAEASMELKGCNSLQDEMHAFAEGHPNAIMFLRKVNDVLRSRSAPILRYVIAFSSLFFVSFRFP